jgi:hypothetical protein
MLLPDDSVSLGKEKTPWPKPLRHNEAASQQFVRFI